MDEARTATSTQVAQFMLWMAEHMRATFPQHARALMDEIQGRRMTSERWHRVAAVLASLYAVPGACLLPSEHDVRNAALSAIAVAQKMASAEFGGRNDVGSCLEFAVWRAAEIRGFVETRKEEDAQ